MNLEVKRLLLHTKVILHGHKKELWLLACTSLFYACTLAYVGTQVEIQSLGQVGLLSFGAGVTLLLRLLVNLHSNFLAIKIEAQAKSVILPKLSESIGFLKSKYNSSEILHRLVVDYENFSQSLTQTILQFISNGLVFLILSGFITISYWKSVPTIVFCLAAVMSCAYLLQLILKKLNIVKMQLDSDLFRIQKNYIFGLEYLKVSSRISGIIERFSKVLSRQMVSDKKISILQHVSESFNWGFRYIFILIIVSPLLLKDNVTPASLYWIYIMLGLFAQIFWTIYHLGQVRVFAERALVLLKENGNNKAIQLHDRLEIRADQLNLFFGNDSQSYGIKNINFALKKGDSLWIEGQSGSGKTSLLRSLLGMHGNFSGAITMPKANFTRAYLSQDPYFFDGESIGHNLNISNITMETQSYIEALNLSTFFEQIDYDLSLKLGTDGVQASKGQKTRLAILRELISKPDLLFLDEPSANLDSASKKCIFNLLNQTSKDRITIICEHDLVYREQFSNNTLLNLDQLSRPSA